MGTGLPTTLESSETDSSGMVGLPELWIELGSEISMYGFIPWTNNSIECPDFDLHHNSTVVLPMFPGMGRLSPEIIQASSLHSNANTLFFYRA